MILVEIGEAVVEIHGRPDVIGDIELQGADGGRNTDGTVRWSDIMCLFSPRGFGEIRGFERG